MKKVSVPKHSLSLFQRNMNSPTEKFFLSAVENAAIVKRKKETQKTDTHTE